MKRALIIIGLIGFVAVIVSKSQSPASPKEIHGTAMGCRWTLAWRGDTATPEILKREVSAVLERWEQVLSQWREHSDLSRYNRGEPATPDLARVLAMAEEIKTATGGAFDPHLLEKVHAAGFGPAGKGIDLSSIGKGWGVDRVGDRLKELGVNDFIFNLAGEAVAGNGSWQVAIERPDPGKVSIYKEVNLRNRAIATSGNYRQFHATEEGLKSHIIDPKTGQPVIRPPSAVTVIARDCARASSWATALFVLGPDFKAVPPDMEIHWQQSPPLDPPAGRK